MSLSYEAQPPTTTPAGQPPNAHLVAPDGYLPAGLDLVQAHWYCRHGERAPVRQRLVGLGDIPAVFSLCSVGREFRSAVLAFAPDRPTGPLSIDHLRVRRWTEQVADSPRGYRGGPADCDWGELTDLGRASTLALGSLLRRIYVPLGFLPPILSVDTAPQVALRSTDMPRTRASLFQIVQGLWPAAARQPDLRLDVHVRGAPDEDLYPNPSCRQLRALNLAASVRAAQSYNPTLARLDSVLAPLLGGPVRLDSAPRASGILDTVLVCRAHGIRVPPELDHAGTLRELEAAVVHEWFDGYRDLEFRKLAMGRLLGSLREMLDAKRRDPLELREKNRLHLYACHDTSLAGILNALDAFDGRWPQFSSHLSLLRAASPAPSLLSRFLPHSVFSPPSPPHYVRLRYNAHPVFLPACAPKGKHLEGNPEACTFEAFAEAVRVVEMSHAQWIECCGSKVE